MRRFYAPRETFDDRRIVLDSIQSKHLRNVLRLQVGDEVTVFNGEGNEFLCLVQEFSPDKKTAFLQIIEETKPAMPESDLDLTLAVSILKNDKFDFVIQKAVELGVVKFIPVITKRSEIKLRNAEKKTERWRKIIIEASKQTGRAKLMEITEPFEFEEFIEDASETKILFSERNGESFSSIKSAEKITAAIGPKGGWEDSELESAAQNDFQIITFGGRILRVETAVISITAVLQHRFGDFV